VNELLIKEIEEISSRNHFFHYHLEFPEVFEKGGFDCLLGNPPWEKINLEDKEFFATRAPKISSIKNSSKRQEAIRDLSQTNLNFPTYRTQKKASSQLNLSKSEKYLFQITYPKINF
jgi:hypothetical protein